MKSITIKNKRTVSSVSHIALTEFRNNRIEKIGLAACLTGKHCQSEIKTPTVLAISGRSKGDLSSRSKVSFSLKTKRSELAYNKWFIHPSKRLKLKQPQAESSKTNEAYFYKNLYRDRYADPDCPFRFQESEKLRLLNLLPKTNFSFLQEFKRSQMKNKKRVPEIVEILIRKRRVKTEM